VAIGTAQQARQLTVTGTASVSGNTAVGGTLTVSGATNLNNTLAVAGATTLGNRLTVQGVTNLNNTLDVAGATTLGNRLTVQGLLTANADAQFNGNVTVGTAEAPRQVRVNGNLVAPGAGINTPTFVFIHQYTGEEASPQTELNHPLLNGNPTAIILVTYNATGSGSLIPLNSSVGVRYDPGTERWYIYTLSGGNDIQPNATFNVMIVTTN
jgi:cytoskeletal protein CcmA (bactofilin family)